jgi:hypothetical protein
MMVPRILARLVVVASSVMSLGFADAMAQPQTEPGDVPVPAAQVQQLFDAMAVMQSQEALSLSETQYAQFLSRLRILQDTRRRHQVQRNRLIGELRRLTDPRASAAASEQQIRARLEALQELESRSGAEIRRAYNAIDEVLDVRQQARFRVLEEQIERRKLELIGRARQATPRRRPPPR